MTCTCSNKERRCRNCQKAANKLITLTPRQEEILTGLMLGDGCIHYSDNNRATTNSNPRLTIRRSAVDYEYAMWLYEELKNLHHIPPSISSVFDTRTQKTYHGVSSQSKSMPCLLPYRNLWYPNDKKAIPQNLQLTPLSLMIWFCDDGCFMPKNDHNGGCTIKLSTHGFDEQDVNFLAGQLSKRYSANFRVCEDDGNHFIASATKGAILFIKEINDIFITCMSRKSDKWKEIDLLDQSLYDDGKLIKDARYTYSICRLILSNEYHRVNTWDLYEKLSIYTRLDKIKLRYYLDKLWNEELLHRKRIFMGMNGSYLEYTASNIETLKTKMQEKKAVLDKF